MEEEIKEGFVSRNRYYLILLLFMLLLFASTLYINRGWYTDKKDMCLGQYFYSKEDLMNGYLCIYKEETFDNCRLIETSLNAEVRECTCLRNNKTVKLYCNMKADIKKYSKGYKKNDLDQEDAKGLLERQTNISLDEYFGRNKTDGGDLNGESAA